MESSHPFAAHALGAGSRLSAQTPTKRMKLKGNLLTFDQRLSHGKTGQQMFVHAAMKAGMVMQEAEGKFLPFDFYSPTNDHFYEVKYDPRAYQYNNVFVETLRNDPVQGWIDYGIAASRADIWAFVTDRDVVTIYKQALYNILVQSTSSCKFEELTGEVDKIEKKRWRVPITLIGSKGEIWQL